MNILLDCDGVLADFSGGVLDRLNKRLGQNFKLSDLTQWDIHKCLGLSFEQVSDLISEEGFVSSLSVYPGAQEAVLALQEFGNVYIVTSPWWSSKHWAYERTEWLHRHFGIKAKNIISTSAKHMIDGDVLVDDKGDHLVDWMSYRHKVRAGGLAYLWNAPWNASERPSYAGLLIPRLHSWQQLIQEVKDDQPRRGLHAL